MYIEMKKNKTLVLYVLHEYNERVECFIEHAIFQDEQTDFLIICNNTSIQLTVPTHVKVLYRENTGYDFAAWSYGLFYNDQYKNYDTFLFVNSSVLGPFLPMDYQKKWTNIYLDGLTDSVKLFGSTINCHYYKCENITMHENATIFSHVQSYIFAMNKETLEYLMECKIFSKTNHSDSFQKTIFNKEIGMSRKIIENNWNIGSLMKRYQNVDFRFIYKKPEEYGIEFMGDVMYPEHVNKVYTLEELVFIKGNRLPFTKQNQ